MNKILYDQDENIANWIMNQLSYITDFGSNYKAYGITRSGKLVAGIAFHDYNPTYQVMQFTVAATSPYWAHPHIIDYFMKYVFEKANVHRLHTYTYIGNEKAIKILLHAGFKQEAIMDSFYGRSHHGVSFRLLRTEYAQRYYGNKNKFRERDQILPPPIKIPELIARQNG